MLKLVNIKKNYIVGPTTIPALRGVSLEFRRSEMVAVLGQSGCGKTTLLNIVGGLDRYTSGDLIIDGKSTKRFKSHDWDAYRNYSVGFVFQSYNLIPHLSVLSNVELALTLKGDSLAKRRALAKEALEKVGLGDQLNKRPNQLSGGQMQRVAIARAIVNKPQIVLADEPTGALDSKTSIQILDLLKEIARDRLVIMVTHNTELADRYATRIVRFLDGEVVGDSHPLTNEERQELDNEAALAGQKTKSATAPAVSTGDKVTVDASKDSKIKANAPTDDEVKVDDSDKTNKKKKKTSMSFFTALNISFRNLWAKKGRTFLVSFAGSIGIIGIALVLAVSNGFSKYIYKLETEALASYPLKVSQTSIDLGSLISEPPSDDGKPQYPDTDYIVTATDRLKELYIINNITTEYVDYVKQLSTLTSASGNHKGESVALAVQESAPPMTVLTRSALLQGQAETVINSLEEDNSMMSLFGGGGNDNFVELMENDDYIKSQYDIIGKGRYPTDEYEHTANGETEYYYEIALVTDAYNSLNEDLIKKLGLKAQGGNVSFDDIIGKEYKLVLTDGIYYKDGDFLRTVNLYDKNVRNDLYNDANKTITLRITGILRPKKESTMTIYNSGLVYRPSLTAMFKTAALSSQAVSMQRALFDSEDGSRIYKSLLSQQTISDMLSNIADTVEALGMMAELLQNAPSLHTNEEAAKAFVAGYMRDIGNAYDPNKTGDENSLALYFAQFAKADGLIDAMVNVMFAENQAIADIYGRPAGLMTAEIMDDSIPSISFDAYWLYYTGTNGILARSAVEDSILRKVGGAAVPSSIQIFPRSFETKKEILAHLDAWNKSHPDNQIKYSDDAALLSSTLGSLINTISYVLVAFAAVSLVVSSIMISIITYVSVIERTKEIGVLRSIGGRKKDIRRLFNAETFIIGLVAGTLGVFVAWLFCFPINAIIGHLTSGGAGLTSIALLNPLHALALVGISIFLTVLSGLIPANIAAKKDPVIALRTE